MAANLALAFLGLCLASCLAPADGHACCRNTRPAISAQTEDCWLDADGVAVAATILPASTGLGAFVDDLPHIAPAAHFEREPRLDASPPFVLRV